MNLAPAELVGRVLWNSGYLTRVSVSGATLRSILQNSEKIKQQEESSTNEPLVRNQDLVTLGVSKANGLYFVDGAAIDDTRSTPWLPPTGWPSKPASTLNSVRWIW